jgi:flagellar biosynthesis protein FliQ
MSSVAAPDLVLRAVREGLLLVLLVSAPAVLACMVVGLVVGILQSASQVQDQALSFVPKVAAVAVVLLLMGPALGAQVVRFSQALLLAIATVR